MTTYDPNLIAAAKLADRYIEIVLATKPEMLISQRLADERFENVSNHAQRLAQFRLQLINELSQQVLPQAEQG